MAADSRLSLVFPLPTPQDSKSDAQKEGEPKINTVQLVNIPQSDATNKLFLAQNRIGISTAGNALVKGVPISGVIESFILTLPEDATPETTADLLVKYFRDIEPNLQTWFHVAGYRTGENGKPINDVWFAGVPPGQKFQIVKPGEQGARWNGEMEIMTRLFTPLYQKQEDGTFKEHILNGPTLAYFTLQDAVDFAVFAARTTIDTMRFLPRPRTVGGPIDVLVIKPDGADWPSQKQLHLSHPGKLLS